MKLTTPRLLIALLTVAIIALGYTTRRQTTQASSPTPVIITRVYTGADQQSHIEQVTVNFAPGQQESEHVKAASTYVVRVPPGYFEDWHHPGHRRYVVPLSGHAELEIVNGEKVAIEPGRIYLAEDQGGKGHTFRVVGGTEWVALFVDLD